jgi:hypothetical protein
MICGMRPNGKGCNDGNNTAETTQISFLIDSGLADMYTMESMFLVYIQLYQL